MKIIGICLTGIAISAAGFGADWKLPANEPKLKAGPGADLVSANCLLCHSADYISTQPRLDRAVWQSIVTKMREKYGAPLPADKIDPVVNYLFATYGKQKK